MAGSNSKEKKIEKRAVNTFFDKILFLPDWDGFSIYPSYIVFRLGNTDILEFSVKLLQSSDQAIMSNGYEELSVCHRKICCPAKVMHGLPVRPLSAGRSSLLWFHKVMLVVRQVLAIHNRGRSCYYGGIVCDTGSIHDRNL